MLALSPGVVQRYHRKVSLRRHVLTQEGLKAQGFENDESAESPSKAISTDHKKRGKKNRETGLGDSQLSETWPKIQEGPRGTWARRLDFILSCIGYSVGLGNVWRFPYLCYSNGGGAFLFPYVIMLVFVGIPLFFLEMAFGQYASLGPITIWKAVPLFKGIGYAMVLCVFVISVYYNVLIAWSLFYLFASMQSELPWKDCNNTWNTPACRENQMQTFNCSLFNETLVNLTCVNTTAPTANVTAFMVVNSTLGYKTPTEEYFHRYMLDVSDGIHNLGTVRWQIACCLLLAWTLLFLCLVKGIKYSGKIVYFTALFPYVLLLVLLIGACLLDGALDGIKYYVIPDFSRLRDGKVWIDAAVQVVWSLGPSVGGLITLSSYSKFHNDCRRDMIIAATTDSLTSFLSGFVIFAMLGAMAQAYGKDVGDVVDQDTFVVATIDIFTSIFAGFVIFSILGVMAFNNNTTVDKVVDKGIGLAFVVYPEAVLHLPVPPFWSILFFLMLVLLGIDSMFTFVETIITALVDEYPHVLRRHRTWLCLGVCAMMFLLGLPMTTRGGIYLLHLIDQAAIGWAILIIGIIECIALAWVYGFDKMASDIEIMIAFRPTFWWNMMWKFVTPGLIFAFLLFSWITNSPVQFHHYTYPEWAYILTYLITPACLISVPIYMVYIVARTPGTVKERIKTVMRPMSDWGPALDIHRALLLYTIPEYISGGDEPQVTPDPCSSKETLDMGVTTNGSVASMLKPEEDDVDTGSVDWEEEENKSRGNWANQYEFILTCLGYSVGLGNVWRFPYLCYRNGGGAFFIPYLIMMVVMGIPLYYLELAMGQYASVGPTLVWRCVPWFKGIGYGFVIVSFYLGIYYNVVTAWSLYYMFASFTAKLGWSTCDNEWNSPSCSLNKYSNLTLNATALNDTLKVGLSSTNQSLTLNLLSLYGTGYPGSKPIPSLAVNKSRSPSEEYFLRHVLDISEGLHSMGNVRWHLALCLLLAWVIVFLCIIRGIKSAGKAAYLMATVPYLILLIFLIRALTLDGHKEGIQFYVTPQWSLLLSAQVWYDAAVQVLFSLSTCYGGLIMLSSYNRFHNNCHRDAILISLGDFATSVFASFVIFATMGVMAKEMGTSVDNVISSDVGLAFIVYPEAVTKLPAPPLWSFLFFFMLFMLGLDTQFVTVETLTVAIVEEFPRFVKKRIYVSMIICIGMYFLGLPLVTEGGIYLIHLFDNYIISWPVLFLALLETGAFSWFYGINRLEKDIKSMIGKDLSYYWKATWLVLTPLIVTAVLVFAFVEYTPVMYGLYKFPWWGYLVAWIMVGLALLPTPVFLIYKLCVVGGSLKRRLHKCIRPDPHWGPALEKHRYFAQFFTPTLKRRPSDTTLASEDIFSTPQSSCRILPPADSIRSLEQLLGAEALQRAVGYEPKRLGELRLGIHAGLLQHLHSVVDDVIIQRRPVSPRTCQEKSTQTDMLSPVQETDLEVACDVDDLSAISSTASETSSKRLSCVNMRAILDEKAGSAVVLVDQDSGPGYLEPSVSTEYVDTGIDDSEKLNLDVNIDHLENSDGHGGLSSAGSDNMTVDIPTNSEAALNVTDDFVIDADDEIMREERMVDEIQPRSRVRHRSVGDHSLHSQGSRSSIGHAELDLQTRL